MNGEDAYTREIQGLVDEIDGLVKKRGPDASSLAISRKLNELIKTIKRDKDISAEESQKLISAIENMKINVPVPQVTVEPPKVEVNVPETKPPVVNVPETVFPKTMAISKPAWFPKFNSIAQMLVVVKGISKKISDFRFPEFPDEPIPVRLSDGDEFYRAGGGSGAVSGSVAPFKDSDGEMQHGLVDSDRHQQIDIVSAPDIDIGNGDPLVSYKISDIDDDASPNYYGYVDKDGAWYILKEDTTAKTYRYVSGSDHYPNNWSERTSLTYYYLYDVFS